VQPSAEPVEQVIEVETDRSEQPITEVEPIMQPEPEISTVLSAST
jgi:hypothetical protein